MTTDSPVAPVLWRRRKDQPRCRRALLACAMLAALATPVAAETFRWSSQSDPSTMDPHAAAVGTNLSFLGNVYEGLVRRGRTLRLEPALATRWEPLGERGWRFHLREGVVFHGGETFDADDVEFTYERTISETSDVRAWMHSIERLEVVDARTVDFLTRSPNPIFPEEIANWLIMDRGWTEANGASTPARETPNHATLHANGTGPFRLVERVPDVRTVLARHDGWWDTPAHDVARAEYRPVKSAATRVAALLSGEVDMIEPVPLQNVAQVKAREGFHVAEGGELRVIMLGMQLAAERLALSSLEGANPFRDARVREALHRAIDADAINAKLMRGAARPIGTLVAPGVNGFTEALGERAAHDPERARALLAEAGYADGFDVGLRCPNDRYVNDAAICTAVAGMLGKVGVTVKLRTVPVSEYWPMLRAKDFDMYLLGWTPGTYDAHHVMRFLVHTPDAAKKLGSWNFAGHSDPELDSIIEAIGTEIDASRRQAMIEQVLGEVKDGYVYLPLHQQPLVWAMRDGVEVVQRADNFFNLRWVRIR